MQHYHTIIVGLGAVGSAAAYQLSRRGRKVLAIDRYAPPHRLGSTHGDSRITRLAIGEGRAYTPLALRSHEIWRELEHLTGLNLLTVTGGLILSKSGAASALHGKSDFLTQTLRSAEEFGIAHEVLSASEIRKRFPQFCVDDDDEGYYEYEAGFLRPERCVAAQIELARALGAQIRLDEQVAAIQPHSDGVIVTTEQGQYHADNAIVAAGPWVSELVGQQFPNLFNVYRQVLYWFDVDSFAQFAPGTLPVFIWDFGNGDGIYGFPAIDGGSGGIKIAAEQYTVATTPDTVDRTVSIEEIKDFYRQRISRRLLGVQGTCLRSETCLYTVTPDSNFIIDRSPEFPQVIVASPCSGHGFKHSAAIGEILADLAEGQESKIERSSFSLARFCSS